MSYDKELLTARKTAAKAGRIQLEAKSDLNVVRKEDDSPVTDVDRHCETIVREELLKNFPQDGFLGEETGLHEGSSGRIWIVDPIDGTRPFIRGIPTHSTLIALQDNGEPVVGVIHLPAMKETYYAARNSGAFVNENPIRVSDTSELSAAFASALGFVEKVSTPEGECLMDLMRQWDYTYGFMDAYSYGCVASGRMDVCVNLLDKPWDCAAAACIVKEAGGRYSDIYGNETVHNGSIVLSNGLVHDAVLSRFGMLETGRR